MNLRNSNLWLWGVGSGILFPVFFQLSGGIYRDVDLMIDSQGVLDKLPLPVSVLTCLIALVFLARKIGVARPALAMIFGAIAACFISLWLGGDGVTPPERKLVMIMQVGLPLIGLLTGQLVDDKGNVIAKAFLVVLFIVVPLQLLASKLQGDHVLTHYLYVFSIYSHRQFVTLIFVCAFVYSMTLLWDGHKFWLCILAIPMWIYVSRSYSFLTIIAYISFIFSFASSKLLTYRIGFKLWLAILCLIATVIGGLIHFGKIDGPLNSNMFYGKFASLAEGNMPSNVQERLDDWKLFGSGIVESKTTIFLGHPQPMPREMRTSPHNYYIDIAYTFGLVALVPILSLIAYTTNLCWRRRDMLPAETWWLAAIVFYLVVIDSNFKVTLRQPYPGIFAYFMWGLLLSRLRAPVAETLGS
jgi:hypothetical protein